MTTEENQDDIKFVQQDDGSAVVELPLTEEEKKAVESKPEVKQPEDDKRLNDDDEEGSEDEDTPHNETEEEAEARRQRNRERRAQNKASRKAHIESMKRELAARDKIIDELSSRVASVEKQSVGNQLATIDKSIEEAQKYYQHFKAVNKKAIEEADGALAVDAQEKMYVAQNRYNALINAKKQMAARQTQAPTLDPRIQANAQAWAERNPWFDSSSDDADSDLTIKIESRILQEGWNPTTKEYWEELDARVKKYLPHRTNSGYNKPQTNSQSGSAPRVPVGGGSSESNGPTKGSYRLSAERVQALKEAGVYDDPKKRADAIRRFQEYDRKAGLQK